MSRRLLQAEHRLSWRNRSRLACCMGHGGIGVGLRRRLSLECLGVDLGAQAGRPIGKAAQDIPGRLPLPVDALDLASGKRAKLRDAAGPVEVQVRIQMLTMKLIDGFGMLAGDMRPAQMFADHRAVLGLHQGVVAGMTSPRLGLLDQEFVQEAGNLIVDELAAVVGMKAADAERKLLQHSFQQGQQPASEMCGVAPTTCPCVT